MTTSTAIPDNSRARRLGLLSSTERDMLAVVVAAVVLAINLMGTVVFMTMMRATLRLQAGSVAAPPPVPKTAEDKASPASTLQIDVHPDGSLYIEGSAVALEDVAALVNKRAPERVLVRASPKVRYPRMKEILNELGRGGATNVTFSVTDKAGPTTVE